MSGSVSATMPCMKATSARCSWCWRAASRSPIIDGIERVIGKRVPEQIFGEVPIVFGTPYQGSYRAAEPARVMNISARQFYALAAAHPAVLTQVAAIAAERIGGLKGIATAPPKARALMLAHAEDDTARQLRTFLGRDQISHDWVLPDAPDPCHAMDRPVAGR